MNDKFAIVTWNIWNNLNVDPTTRAQLLVAQILQEEIVHVLLFQEVTPEMQREIDGPLREAGFLYWTPAPAPASQPYYTLIVSRFPLRSVKRVPFARSTMYRDWLCASVELPSGEGCVFVSTSHLESLGSGSLEREQQFNAALAQLHGDKGACAFRVFAGDLNLKTQSDGDVQVPQEYYTDCWLATHQCEQPPCLCGSTRLTHRIDRVIIAQGGHCTGCRVIGKQSKVSSQQQGKQITASDHFGVYASFSLSKSQAPGQANPPPRVNFPRPKDWMKYI